MVVVEKSKLSSAGDDGNHDLSDAEGRATRVRAVAEEDAAINVTTSESSAAEDDLPMRQVRRKKKKKPHYFRQLDSLNTRMKRGKPGSRRYNRWMNDVMLGRDPTDLFDTGVVGVDEEWFLFHQNQKSAFSSIVSDESKLLAISAYFDITEEDERVLLAFSEQSNQRRAQVRANSAASPTSNKEKNKKRKNGIADASLRKALRKYVGSSLLLDLQSAVAWLVSSIRHSLAASPVSLSASTETAMPAPVSEYVVIVADDRNAQPSLSFDVTGSFHRLLVHGVAQYYGLSSETIGEEEADKRVIVQMAAEGPPNVPSMCVIDYLMLEENKVKVKHNKSKHTPRHCPSIDDDEDDERQHKKKKRAKKKKKNNRYHQVPQSRYRSSYLL